MRTYKKPTIDCEFTLRMDNPVLSGANSVAKKEMDIVHEGSGAVDEDWSTDWTE